ncbi:MAG: hypothetical protein OEY22_01650 [Candidatus Bathyarchaeota archaeon]|nr:hypothetical protein [Candidatus Bathyarchaeota archaeon]
MKRQLLYALILNVALLIIFVLVDRITWMRSSYDFAGLGNLGSVRDLSFSSFYEIVFRGLGITGHQVTETSFEGFNESSVVFNFPVLVVLALIVVNLYLVWKKD